MKQIYMDHAATTPANPSVVQAILPYYCEKFGNPSSIHVYGRESKKALDEARELTASFINAGHDEIYFTSGGTESDNWALQGVAYAMQGKGDHIISSKIEHHAVLNCLHFLEKRGFRVTYLDVDEYGLVDPNDVKKAITPKTILVSIMHANNEMGTIEPIGEIGKVCRDKEVYFHTDAVQTFGHMPVDVKALNVDLLSASAHKLYGPKGVGLLFIRKGVKIVPFLHGGEQERGKRASTENVPGIVGFAKAVELAGNDMESENKRILRLRDKFIKGIQDNIEDTRLNGHPLKRLSNNINVSIKYIEGESMILNLDLEGIAASTGSACSSGSLDPSHVLLALGLKHEDAHASLRFSLGRQNNEEDVDIVLNKLTAIVSKLRAMSPLIKK